MAQRAPVPPHGANFSEPPVAAGSRIWHNGARLRGHTYGGYAEVEWTEGKAQPFLWTGVKMRGAPTGPNLPLRPLRLPRVLRAPAVTLSSSEILRSRRFPDHRPMPLRDGSVAAVQVPVC
jgi:hypothetical protein